MRAALEVVRGAGCAKGNDADCDVGAADYGEKIQVMYSRSYFIFLPMRPTIKAITAEINITAKKVLTIIIPIITPLMAHWPRLPGPKTRPTVFSTSY